MPLLIDAYNVLHVVGVLPPDLAGIDLPELADLIVDSRYRRESTILVCDGVEKAHHRVEAPGIHVRFAGPGVKADDLIIRLVQRSSAPKRLTIVTSDREIARASRRRRATVMTSELFLHRLSEDRNGPPARGASERRHSADHPADRRQVEHWLRVFGIDADDPGLQIPPSPTRRSTSPSGASPSDKRGDARKKRGRSSGSPPAVERPGILEAEHLADIDPDQIDRIDMNRLIDDSDRLRERPGDEPGNPGH